MSIYKYRVAIMIRNLPILSILENGNGRRTYILSERKYSPVNLIFLAAHRAFLTIGLTFVPKQWKIYLSCRRYMEDAGTFIFLLEIVLSRMKAIQRCESITSRFISFSGARRTRIKRNPANKEGISSLVISNFSYMRSLCFHVARM